MRVVVVHMKWPDKNQTHSELVNTKQRKKISNFYVETTYGAPPEFRLHVVKQFCLFIFVFFFFFSRSPERRKIIFAWHVKRN